MSLDDRIKLAEAAIDETTIDYSEWIRRVAQGYKGKPYAYETTAWHRTFVAAAPTKNAWLELLDAAKTDEPVPPLPGPEPEPPPAGEVWHEDGFATHTFANWSYAQPTMAQAATWVEGLRAGSNALRVTLKAGDANAGGFEAAQLTKINPGHYRLGQTDYYAARFRLVQTTNCFDFLTFAYPTVRGGTISLNVQNSQVCLHMNTGRTVSWAQPSHEFMVWADPLSNVAHGQWQDVLLTIERATTSTGSLKIEHRYDGAGSWRTVWERASIPTCQYGVAIPGYGEVDAKGINLVEVPSYNITPGMPRDVLDKLGPYRAPLPAGSPDFVVDYDVYRACTSRELALAALA